MCHVKLTWWICWTWHRTDSSRCLHPPQYDRQSCAAGRRGWTSGVRWWSCPSPRSQCSVPDGFCPRPSRATKVHHSHYNLPLSLTLERFQVYHPHCNLLRSRLRNPIKIINKNFVFMVMYHIFTSIRSKLRKFNRVYFDLTT